MNNMSYRGGYPSLLQKGGMALIPCHSSGFLTISEGRQVGDIREVISRG